MFGSEPMLVLTVALVVFAAALISAMAGFAFSALAGGALVYLLQDPVRTLAILAPCSIAIHGYCAWSVRRELDWRKLAPFVLAGALTVPLGVWLLARISVGLLASGLGMFLVVYGAYLILGSRRVLLRSSALLDATVGGVGGLLAGLAGLSGASVSVWCGLRGWDKERSRALCQPFILLMQIEALPLLRATRPAALPAETFYLYVPAALAAAWLGVALLRKVSGAQFDLLVRLALVLCGAALLYPALVG
ncbi:MAG TPA: sulfite exporter TauE/SafE family protein [Burkholderiales bacterium]|jgi:hypothetical protein